MVRVAVAAWISARRPARPRGQPPSGGHAPVAQIARFQRRWRARRRRPRRGTTAGRPAWRGVATSAAPRATPTRPDEHDRVRERVVVVVGQARDDDREAAAASVSEAGSSRQGRARTSGPPSARRRSGAAPAPGDDPDDDGERGDGRAERSVIRPVSGQATTRSATTRRRVDERRGPRARRRRRQVSRVPRASRRSRASARGRPAGRRSRAMIARPASPARSDRAALGAGSRGDARRPRGARRRPAAGSTPSTWHCIVTAARPPASSHQRALRVDQARHAPASAIALDRAIRFGFQMNVDSSIARGRDGHQAARPRSRPPVRRSSAPATT